jgi:hypothetical protein
VAEITLREHLRKAGRSRSQKKVAAVRRNLAAAREVRYNDWIARLGLFGRDGRILRGTNEKWTCLQVAPDRQVIFANRDWLNFMTPNWQAGYVIKPKHKYYMEGTTRCVHVFLRKRNKGERNLAEALPRPHRHWQFVDIEPMIECPAKVLKAALGCAVCERAERSGLNSNNEGRRNMQEAKKKQKEQKKANAARGNPYRPGSMIGRLFDQLVEGVGLGKFPSLVKGLGFEIPPSAVKAKIAWHGRPGARQRGVWTLRESDGRLKLVVKRQPKAAA